MGIVFDLKIRIFYIAAPRKIEFKITYYYYLDLRFPMLVNPRLSGFEIRLFKVVTPGVSRLKVTLFGLRALELNIPRERD